MPGKASKRRYRAMLAEVEAHAWAAYRAGRRDNPYPADDPRHARFAQRLNSISAAGAVFDL